MQVITVYSSRHSIDSHDIYDSHTLNPLVFIQCNGMSYGACCLQLHFVV